MGVHGDKTVVGGKTSTLNSLSPTNSKKKTPTEISSNLKSNSKKASSSPAAGSGQRANASASVDANMAPALTEPISPTEKLSAASVSPTAATISTESEECKSETTITTAATTSSPAIASSSRASPANRERRATTRNTVAPSTRVTRSKDNAAQERANTPNTAVRDSPTATVTSLRKSKRNSKEQDNEQMGLSAATPSAAATTTTNSPTPTIAAVSTPADTSASTSTNNNNNNNIACKDNSTAQLLADLTTDFEETITAEICLRKQLPEVKVTTPDAAQLSASSETESETTASKSAAGGGETPEIGSSTKPMETVADNPSGSGVCKNDNLQTKAEEPPKLEKQIEEAKVQNVDEPPENTNLPVDHSSTAESAAVLDLPPVNSDSTMTASEEEPEELDALEAKLSQLDGTAVENTISAFVNDTANVTLTPTTFASTIVTATTPPQSQPQQQVMVQPQQQNQQMLPQTATASGSTPTQQLLLTPTGSTTSSQHMLALTPQSTSSLLREMTAAGVPGGGGELEDQELEEVLKALKGFDANAAGAEGVLCDLNVLLNEVYTTFNCDEMAATNSGAAGGNVGSGAIQQHHQQQQQQPQTNLLASTSAAAITKLSTTSPLKELHVDIEKKQQIMQRKIDIILRRLRKLQVRYMSKHTTEEIAGLFELAARITHKGSNSDGVNSTKDMLAASVISARPPPRSWEEDLKTAISSTEMLNLLERLEKSANSQQICTATTSNSSSSPTYASPTISTTQQMRKSKKFSELSSSSAATTTSSSTAAGATSSSCTTITATADGDAQRSDDCVIPILNPQVVDELTHVTGMLRAEMRDIQVAYDSDATESSSGGESADEMVAYNNQVQQSLSIVKRAAWRYSRERAAIASRWSWLLSQIADLEIKIRQHSELFQEVVRTKGAVVCEEELARASTTGREPLINAYGENEEIILTGSCRTRGFLPSQFRKRKMLQTTSLHTISKKAARPSTIKCGCQCPLNPCALCTGRTDPTAPRDLPDTMMFPERVALLDPGFHPVLSFSDNVSNSIHFEAIARTPHWQNRIVRIQPKSVVRSVWKAEREAANLNSHHSSRKYGDILMPTQKRRYIRRKERNVVGNKAASTSADLDATTTDFAMPAAAPASTPPIHKTTAISKFETSTPTAAAGAGATTSTLAARNGTATLFGSTTPTTTPLVANKMTSKNVLPSKKMHCLLVGDGVLLEPLSPNNTNNNNSLANSCQTPQNYDPYNPSQTPSSLISNSQQQHNNNNSSSNTNKKRHYKRKSVISLQQQFSSSSNNNNSSHINHTQHSQLQQTQAHSYNHNNNTQSNTNSNGDINFDYWDTAAGGRSRTASPTHGIIGGSSSNYHKYERSLERRNRISYDIDNIVIPYSVAAATRVEILPYKEIPTPKWRVFDDELAFDQEQEEENSTEHLETKVSDKQQSEIKQQNEQQQNEATTTATTINNLQENKNIIKSDKTNIVDDEDDDDKKFAKPAEAIKLFKDLQKHTNENETKELLTSTKAQICDKTKTNCVYNKTTTTNAPVASNNIDESEHLPPPAKKWKVDTINAEVNENANDTATSSSSGNVCSLETTQETILAADLNEEITDEAFNLRHERALHEERRKFQTYLKFPWSTRSRANRRIDSRAESSGANTPDPASPAPNTPSLGGGDQESIPSPLAPSTPLTPLDAVNEASESGSVTNASSTHSSAAATAPPVFPLNAAAILSNYSSSGNSKRNERRRTTSTKTQHSAERNERRSLTPDSREVPSFAIPPFEPLKFPLSQESYDTLASVTYMPPSVSSLYADGGDLSKQQHEFEQQHNSSNSVVGNILGVGGVGSHFKTVTPRNGRRTTSTSKVVSCDFSGRKRRPYRRQQSIRDAEHKVADSNDDDITMKAATATTSLINGKITSGIGVTAHSTDVDDDYDEDDDYEDYYDELAEEDDDGYPKHPLAPGMDIDNLVDDENDDYDNYGIAGIGGGGGGGNKLGNHSNNHLGLSDSEFSEPDPFEDDDPNDPEWKGESSTKNERHSERLRKRPYF